MSRHVGAIALLLLCCIAWGAFCSHSLQRRVLMRLALEPAANSVTEGSLSSCKDQVLGNVDSDSVKQDCKAAPCLQCKTLHRGLCLVDMQQYCSWGCLNCLSSHNDPCCQGVHSELIFPCADAVFVRNQQAKVSWCSCVKSSMQLAPDYSHASLKVLYAA